MCVCSGPFANEGQRKHVKTITVGVFRKLRKWMKVKESRVEKVARVGQMLEEAQRKKRLGQHQSLSVFYQIVPVIW